MNNYSSFAHSSIGAMHVINGTVCQDCSLCADKDRYSFASVADGHGSPQYLRTNIGSRFAVECALRGVEEFMDIVDGVENILTSKKRRRKLFEQLWRNIVGMWYESIEKHYLENPFTEEELNSLPPELEMYREYYAEGNFLMAYGTTLIFFVSSEEFAFGIQIGDGKCVIVAEDGSAYAPIADDPRCYDNVTTSMCQNDAMALERICYFEKGAVPPAVFLGTDGIDKSCWNEDQLYDLYREFAISFADMGFESAVRQIGEFLPQITTNGSGDDVSIAGIVNIEHLRKCVGELRDSSEKQYDSDEGYDNVQVSHDDIKGLLSILIEDSMSLWEEPDIYAVSLFYYNYEENPCKPAVVLGYNTTSEFDVNKEFALNDSEARWSYVFWPQNEELCFGTDDTEKVVRQWIKCSGFPYDEDVSDPDDEKYKPITKAFIDLLVEIVQELHSSEFIKNTFGKEIPVLIHELEYNSEIAQINIKANGKKLVKDFVKFCEEEQIRNEKK